jgi:hypothetical protein
VKEALTISLTNVIYNNRRKSNKAKIVVCKERISMIPVVIYTRKDFCLLNALNDKIETFKAAGLVDFWQSEFRDKNFINVKESREPKVLKLKQMIGSFYILLIGNFMSFFIFVIEWIVKII